MPEKLVSTHRPSPEGRPGFKGESPHPPARNFCTRGLLIVMKDGQYFGNSPVMKSLSLAATLFSICALTGCVSQGQSYASKHPELSPAQRQILVSGKIPSGDAVAGLTRAQVKLAMGGDPATFDKINGEDAWVYVHKKAVARDASEDAGHAAPSSSFDSNRSFTEAENFGPRTDVDVKTTIFFQGDRATHTQTTEEKP